jgi:5-methylcytosine-specific restriction endonuclease McrBC GTP-binding regulatory subunit McrB
MKRKRFTLCRIQTDLLNEEIYFGLADFDYKTDAKLFRDTLQSYYPDAKYEIKENHDEH